MSPVIHRGDDTPSGEGSIFKNTATGRRVAGESQVKKAEQAAVKREVLRKFKVGERVVDKVTGAIAVVDASAPTGLRPLWKAGNAHNHGSMLRLGVEPVSKSKVYDGREYGDLSGTKSGVTKRRDDRPANPNSRI